MRKFIFYTVIILSLASCQTYQPLDFDRLEIHKGLLEKKQDFSSENQLSFKQSTKLMSENNLELKLLIDAYKGLDELAKIKTPYPNPRFEIGPSIGSNIVDKTASSIQPFIGFGFSIPLGPRLRKNDDLNQIKALKAYNETLIKHRDLYFDLRESYILSSISKNIVNANVDIENNLKLIKKSAQKLIDFGTSTKLTATGIDIQLSELELTKLELQIEHNKHVAVLASLLVIDLDSLLNISLDKVQIRDLNLNFDQLRDSLLENNPQLAQIEMKFHESDAELRLELAKQYPDLNVGFNAEQEVGEKKKIVSIPFSIEIPAFDRNKQQISQAFSKRQLILKEYEVALANKSSKLEELVKHFYLVSKKLKHINENLIPLTKSQVLDSEKALKAGTINAITYLNYVANDQLIKIKKLTTEKVWWQSIIEIEKLTGKPIINLGDKILEPLSKILKDKDKK